jgi:Xaa-Pro aminopeptidase
MSESSATTFDSEFFAGNRAKLKALFVGSAPIVISANGLLQQSMDTTFPFKQDGNFWYLTGINQPDILLVMDKDKEYLIVPEQSQSKQDFDGAIDKVELSRISGISKVLDQKTGWKQLSSRIAKVKHLATLSPSPTYIEQLGFYTNPARQQLVDRLKEINPQIEMLDLRQHFAKMRMVKQPAELKAIEQAIAITVDSVKYLKSKLAKYDDEYQIDADLTYRFKSKHRTSHGFTPIIASGQNACVIHYVRNSGPIEPKGLILFDVGAEFENYSADISRTYSYSGEPSKRQKQIYQAVLEVQDYAISLLKPGVILHDYEDKIEQYMGEKLRTLGLIKNVEHSEIRKYFPHSTSHHLGFDVHDLGLYDQPLEPGNVITVEPGIYVPEEGIGVRIEDDILITEAGVKVLTEKLLRGLN